MGLSSVISDIAPLYHGPGTTTGRIDEVLYGMSVQMIQQDDSGWCYVRTEHHTEGYTPASCLEQSAEVAAAWRKYKKHVVLAPYIDVQQQPGPTAARVASLPRGGILVALSAADPKGWQKVGLPSGAVGYTRASYIGEVIADWSRIAEDDMRWNIVESALSYNGTAFRAGGRSPLGIDSVGLAAMSYVLNGASIHRESFFKPGGGLHEIRYDDVDEGDLLYFAGSVGVYIGNGKVIHATEQPGAEGVIVSSLKPKDEDYDPALAEHIVACASLY